MCSVTGSERPSKNRCAGPAGSLEGEVMHIHEGALILPNQALTHGGHGFSVFPAEGKMFILCACQRGGVGGGGEEMELVTLISFRATELFAHISMPWLFHQAKLHL